MKSIIIATANRGKFEQIANILTFLNVRTNQFLSLADLNITNNELEIGNMLDRAKQKASYCLSAIKIEEYSRYLCIIGNDVGTKLPTVNIETTESKKIASEILDGKLLKAGDPIHYIYTYAFILLPHQEMLTSRIEIPFTYLGNPLGLKQVEGQNIMSQVKAIPGQTIPHSQIPIEVEIEYRLKFLRKAIAPIVNRINDSDILAE